ncbi:MAG: GDSL-type esterase/lipase family protein [Lentisphaeraceae bacterium]|nr:GDSL-type esterase/lipase family protein [Lentisphaeraceae bacterium]
MLFKLKNRTIQIIIFLTFLCSYSLIAEKTEKVLCFGDSITHDGKWLQMVTEKTSYEFINCGRSGRRVSQAYKELLPYLKKYTGSKIIILLGVNDLPARDRRPDKVKVDSCVEGMKEVVNELLKGYKPENIILLGPCKVNPKTMSSVNLKKGYHVINEMLKDLNQKYSELAQKKGIKFYSLENVVSPENLPDGLHPDENGDKEIANFIINFLKNP